jgi:hypothetical protein
LQEECRDRQQRDKAFAEQLGGERSKREEGHNLFHEKLTVVEEKATQESNNLREVQGRANRAHEGDVGNLQEQLERERAWREAHAREMHDQTVASQQRVDSALDNLREENHQSLTNRATHIENTLMKTAEGLRGDVDRLASDTAGRHERHESQLEKERQTRERHVKDAQEQLDELHRKTLAVHESHANSVRDHLEKYRGEHRDQLDIHRQEGQSLHDHSLARLQDMATLLETKASSLELTMEQQHNITKTDIENLRDLINSSLHTRVATTVLPSRVSSRIGRIDENMHSGPPSGARTPYGDDF